MNKDKIIEQKIADAQKAVTGLQEFVALHSTKFDRAQFELSVSVVDTMLKRMPTEAMQSVRLTKRSTGA